MSKSLGDRMVSIVNRSTVSPVLSVHNWITVDELFVTFLKDSDIKKLSSKLLLAYANKIIDRIVTLKSPYQESLKKVYGYNKDLMLPINTNTPIGQYTYQYTYGKEILDNIKDLIRILEKNLLNKSDKKTVEEKLVGQKINLHQLKDDLILSREIYRRRKHKIVKVKKNGKLSNDVAGSFLRVVKEVKKLTGKDIAEVLSDSYRELAQLNPKVGKGGDNFSFHKTGRAVDLDQGNRKKNSNITPDWVVVEDQKEDGMYYKIYLRHKNEDTKPKEPFIVNNLVYDKKKYMENDPYKIEGKSFVNVTAILEKHGWNRIRAHEGYKNNHDLREWWHYEKRFLVGSKSRLTWYQALLLIETEDKIVEKLMNASFIKNRNDEGKKKDKNRLLREGVPQRVIDRIYN